MHVDRFGSAIEKLFVDATFMDLEVRSRRFVKPHNREMAHKVLLSRACYVLHCFHERKSFQVCICVCVCIVMVHVHRMATLSFYLSFETTKPSCVNIRQNKIICVESLSITRASSCQQSIITGNTCKCCITESNH